MLFSSSRTKSRQCLTRRCPPISVRVSMQEAISGKTFRVSVQLETIISSPKAKAKVKVMSGYHRKCPFESAGGPYDNGHSSGNTYNNSNYSTRPGVFYSPSKNLAAGPAALLNLAAAHPRHPLSDSAIPLLPVLSHNPNLSLPNPPGIPLGQEIALRLLTHTMTKSQTAFPTPLHRGITSALKVRGSS